MAPRSKGPLSWSQARFTGLARRIDTAPHPAPTCRQHQHTHLHLGGHSVNLRGEEPRILAPVVGSEVQNDPDAWNNGGRGSREKDFGVREKEEINKYKPVDYSLCIMWHKRLDLNSV